MGYATHSPAGREIVERSQLSSSLSPAPKVVCLDETVGNGQLKKGSPKATSSGKPPAGLSYATPQRGSGARRASAGARRPSRGYPVWVHVYDLGPVAKWTLNSWATSDSHIGAFHCGVEVLGLEFSFQAVAGSKDTPDNISGLTWHKPKTHPRHLYRESIPLGLSPLGAMEISALLQQMEGCWPARSYNCITRNCTDFAAKLVTGLKVPVPFPIWVHGIAKRLLAEASAPQPAPRSASAAFSSCCPAPGAGSSEVLPEEEISLPAASRSPPEAEEIMPGADDETELGLMSGRGR